MTTPLIHMLILGVVRKADEVEVLHSAVMNDVILIVLILIQVSKCLLYVLCIPSFMHVHVLH